MAVIKQKARANTGQKKTSSSALQALTTAALTLPGLMLTSAQAADDQFSFQYGRYEENGNNKSIFQDLDQEIQVDSLQGSWSTMLTDRLKLRVNYTQDTWSGASPVTTAPAAILLRDDAVSGASAYWFVESITPFDPKSLSNTPVTATTKNRGFVPAQTSEVVHVLGIASPEVRNQGDFNLSYEWDNLALNVGTGISVERDYDSRFINLGLSKDFNQKLTTLTLGGSYTGSTIDAERFLFRATNGGVDPKKDSSKVKDRRKDWSGLLGLTQVLGKNTVLDLGFKYTDSSGYLSNPYKESVFVGAFSDPLISPELPEFSQVSYAFSRYEIRPRRRKQFTWSAGLTQYVPWFDAAVKLDYSFFHDSWGINAHTFALSWGQPLGYGWTVTPKIRYYSQTAADFYSPFFITETLSQAEFFALRDSEEGLRVPTYFSSDHRLSAYGTLGAGITLKKEFAKGISFQAGFEYYTHKGSLKLGGGGEGDFADFHYYVANAAVTVDMSAAAGIGGEHGSHRHHHHREPAGIMAGHMLKKAGDVMVGYRFMHGNRDGSLLHGSSVVDNRSVETNACLGGGCILVLNEMSMNKHLFSLMYAPTDWLNLMVSPQFVDMNMKLIDPDPFFFASRDKRGGHLPTGRPRSSGGVGDTLMSALIKVFDTQHHHLHLGLGLSAPTGDVDLKLPGLDNDDRPELGLILHYGMQLGSGTWDFKPSLTYTGQMDDWSWGAQVGGTLRLESANEVGYRLGDQFHATAWGSYKLLNWLSVSARGLYSAEGEIKGKFNLPNSKVLTVDNPANYGGRYWDVGFGLNVSVPSGGLVGNNLSVEWLQPVGQDVNGYQVEREGTIIANWSYTF